MQKRENTRLRVKKWRQREKQEDDENFKMKETMGRQDRRMKEQRINKVMFKAKKPKNEK